MMMVNIASSSRLPLQVINVARKTSYIKPSPSNATRRPFSSSPIGNVKRQQEPYKFYLPAIDPSGRPIWDYERMDKAAQQRQKFLESVVEGKKPGHRVVGFGMAKDGKPAARARRVKFPTRLLEESRPPKVSIDRKPGQPFGLAASRKSEASFQQETRRAEARYQPNSGQLGKRPGFGINKRSGTQDEEFRIERNSEENASESRGRRAGFGMGNSMTPSSSSGDYSFQNNGQRTSSDRPGNHDSHPPFKDSRSSDQRRINQDFNFESPNQPKFSHPTNEMRTSVNSSPSESYHPRDRIDRSFPPHLSKGLAQQISHPGTVPVEKKEETRLIFETPKPSSNTPLPTSPKRFDTPLPPNEPESTQPETTATGKTGPWRPTKKLTYAAMAGLKSLHANDPKTFTKQVLSRRFGISYEAVSRILKSNFQSKYGEGASEEDSKVDIRGTKWDLDARSSSVSPVPILERAFRVRQEAKSAARDDR